MTSTGPLAGALVGAAIFLGASAAQAQEAEGDPSGFTIFGWSVAGHLSAEVKPDYLGGNSYSVGPTGSLQFYKPGHESRFSAPDDSPGLEVLGDTALSAGVVARLRSGRDDSDLHGVHKIDFAVEPGVYVQWWPLEYLRLRGEARHGVMGNSAWSGDLSADLVHDDPKWLLSIGPRLHLGDSRFTRTYFDITATDAARNPYGVGPYASNGTFVSWGGLASAEYRWSRRWSILADVTYDRLTGDAADSPIVARLGSPNQYGGEIGVRYRFGG